MKIKDLKKVLDNIPDDLEVVTHKVGKPAVLYDIVNISQSGEFLYLWIANREHRKRDVTCIPIKRI